MTGRLAERAPACRDAAPLPTVAGYQVDHLLARGGLGDLYAARATRAGDRRVVIKLARADRSSAGACLAREQASLARLGPPWTPALIELTCTDRGAAALVVEYLPWPVLADRLRAGRLGHDEAIALGGALVDVVAAIHERGVMHGDLKPDNVLVRPDRAGVRLIDFGTVGALGAPDYAAPEQDRGELGARGDVYACAVVLYELLVGATPFRGSPAELRQAHRGRRAPAPSRSGAPAAFDGVLARALAKQPGDRFADGGELRSAWHAAVTSTRAARAGRAGDDAPPACRPSRVACTVRPEQVPASEGAREAHAARVDRADPSVGRERILDELTASARDGLAASTGTLVTLEGVAGVGKSRLAGDLVTRLRAAGTGVIHLECVAPGHRERDLCSWLGLDEAAFAGADPADLAALRATIDPTLRSPAVARMASAPGAIRRAAARALAAGLVERAAANGLAIVIDDAHHAPLLLIDALDQATLAERAVAVWACLLTRRGLGATHPRLGERAGVALRRELPGLDAGDARALCRALLADVDVLPERAVEQIVSRAGGLPLLITELARAIRGDRVRARTGGGLYLETDRLALAGDGDLVAAAARSELVALDRDLADFARVLATLGPWVDVAMIDAIADDVGAGRGLDVAVAIDRLVAAGLLVCSDRVRFRHALIAEAMAADLDRERRRACHRAAYHWLVDRRAAPGIVAHHAEHAGLAGAAASAWLDAAEIAIASHAYLEAEQAASSALALLDSCDRRYARATRARGLVRYRLGRHDDALGDFAVARALASGNGDAALAGEVLLDEATALDWIGDHAAAAARVREAGTANGATGLVSARLAMAEGRARWRAGDDARAIPLLDEAARLAAAGGDAGYETWVAAVVMLGFILPGHGQIARAAELLDRALAESAARGDALHRAAALNNRYAVSAATGDLPRARADLAEFTRLGRELGMVATEYRGELYQGVLAGWLERDGEARVHGERAHAIEQRMPDLFPDGSAQVLLAELDARAGDRAGVARRLAALGDLPSARATHATVIDALERWLAGDLALAGWLARSEQAACAGDAEAAFETLIILATELERRDRASEAARARSRARSLPGVPAFLVEPPAQRGLEAG